MHGYRTSFEEYKYHIDYTFNTMLWNDCNKDKKMQKIHQFKLLTLFSYQIILPVVFLNFFFVNNEKKLQSGKGTARAFVTLKKCFSTVYEFWKQKYINQNGSGLVVKIVKCSRMVPDSIPCKTFFFIKFIQTSQKGRY